MKLQPFAFFVFMLAGGILFQYYFNFSPWVLIFGLLCISLFLAFSFVKNLNQLFSLSSLFLIFIIGAQVYYFHQIPANLYQLKPQEAVLKIKLTKALKPSEKFIKYTGEIKSSAKPNLKDQGLLVYIPQGTKDLLPGHTLWVKGNLQPIPSPNNPHQFNYQRFLAHKNIALQLFSKEIYKTSPELTVDGWFWKHKLKIKQRLKENEFSPLSIAFISSLGLGDRTEFDPEFTQSLSYAGVLHLFAISGLHVGIIFYLLMLVGYPFLWLTHGRNIRILFALLMIWLYAWFIGFTPSVTRASLMLSIYYMSFLLHRPTNVYHALALTAFCLLLFQPHQLFDVGFQLSFSAVFFIVYLNPIREKYRLKIPKRLRYPYDIAMISIFAQFGVLPITLYYFGHFSLLFLGANIILISIASILVGLCLFLAIGINFFMFPSFVVSLINKGTGLIDLLVTFFSNQKEFIFHNISWNFIQITCWIFLLLLLKEVLLKFSWKTVLAMLIGITLMESSRLTENYMATKKQQFIVFHQSQESVMGWRNGRTLHLFYNGSSLSKLNQFTLSPFMRKEKIQQIKIHSWNDSLTDGIFHKKDKKIIVGDTKVTLNPNIANLQFAAIISTPQDSVYILDGNYYPYYFNQAKTQFNPLHYTRQEGAYVLEDF